MRSLLLGAIFAALLITRTLDTDAFRAQHGLRPLAYSATLFAAAHAHAARRLWAPPNTANCPAI